MLKQFRKTKRLCHSVLALCAVQSILCQPQQVPHVCVRSLEGHPVRIPDPFLGHATILVIGYSDAAIEESRTWNKQLNASIRQLSGASVYQVAVIRRTMPFVVGLKVDELRMLVPASQRARVLVATDETNAWHTLANSWVGEDAYVIVLDPDARPCWELQGKFSTGGLAAIREAVPICAALSSGPLSHANSSPPVSAPNPER